MGIPTTEQIQYAKYKWEFLRRNPEFLAYCEKHRVNGEDYIPMDRPWGLTIIIDPSLSYEDHVRRKIDGHRFMFEAMGIPLDAPVMLSVDSFGPSDKLAGLGLFTIRIDLNYSKNRILEEFKTIVDDLEARYQKEHTHRRKLHFDNYDDYLKVYDLRQEGKSWSKIKELLHLNSVQTARNHYGAACKRIEKGLDTYIE